MNIAQDESTLQESQKDEVAITADEFISTSQKADRHIGKQNDVESTTELHEPDKSKSTRGDENKPE